MANPVLERVPQLRRITNMPVFRRGLTIARQNSLVDERVRFLVGEIRGGTRSYRLAADPICSVVLRHGTLDIEVFAEIFRPPLAYEPPPRAAEVLQAIAVRRPLRVLDLGANVGLFAVYILSNYPGAEVTSYEPEPENIRVLTKCAAHNAAAKWTVMQACAMTTDGEVRITPGRLAHTCVSESGVAVAGVDVLPLLSEYDFVKIDIEGSEWPILRDERWPDAMRHVTAFVLEWHTRGCATRDPHAAALAAIDAAGFKSASGPYRGAHGVIWGWRSASHPYKQ